MAEPMTVLDALDAGLIALGAAVLVLAARRTRSIARLQLGAPARKTWRVLRTLIWALVAGFAAAAAAIALDHSALPVILLSLVGLGGALFIYLVVGSSQRSLQALVDTTVSQRQL